MQVDRYTKTRKTTFTSFELFSVKERDIPMEVCALLPQSYNPKNWMTIRDGTKRG